MVIYNTTYCISDRMYGSFVKWLRASHLPKMLGTGIFFEPVIGRVLSDDNQQSGTSVSVQLRANSITEVADWNDADGDNFRKEIKTLFGEEVLFFSTFLEVM